MNRFFIILMGCLSVVFSSYGQDQNSIVWADTVLSYSSYFHYEKYPQQYRPQQVLGKPNVIPGTKFSPCAFTPKTKSNSAGEYIQVGYSKAIRAKQVIISQNANSGFVSKVFVENRGEGHSKLIYEDTVNEFQKQGELLSIQIGDLDFDVDAVRVELNTSNSTVHNQLDAIGISSSNQPYEIKVNIRDGLPNVEKENLGKIVNSEANELLPVVSPDGQTLFIVRQNHKDNLDYDKQNVWTFDISSDSISGRRLGYPINFKGANSALTSITPDGQRVLLINVFDKQGNVSKGISMAQKTDTSWTFPEEVKIKNFYNHSKYGEYFLSNSGNILLMAIQRDDTYGAKDIYVSRKLKDGWSEPINLGPVINTGAGELSPFLSADNRTLYFATPGLPGFGKADIFMSQRIGDGWTNWTEPINLGENYNTPDFDAYLSIPADGEYIYLASHENSYGESDIFRVKLVDELSPEPVVLIKGVVRNSKTNEFIQANINYSSLNTGERVGEAQSDPASGKYQIILPAGTTYGFSALKEGYLPVSSSVDCEVIKQYSVIERDLFLTPIEKGAKIILNNIYFSTGKYDLRKASFVELDQLVEIMNSNNMELMISGHTDDVGTEGDNQLLSENRAKAVVDYLVSKGIDRDRLTAKGFGELKPVVPNSNDENRQKNRRVEFEVLNLGE